MLLKNNEENDEGYFLQVDIQYSWKVTWSSQ